MDVQERDDGLYDLLVEFTYGSQSALGILNNSIALTQNSKQFQDVKKIAKQYETQAIANNRDRVAFAQINSYFR